MENDLYIVGTGGLAREIADILPKSNISKLNFRGFISEYDSEIGVKFAEGLIIGSDSKLPFNKSGFVNIIIGIGKSQIRNKVACQYSKLKNVVFPNLIDNDARVSKNVSLGFGNILFKNCFVSTGVSIKNFNLFNWNVTVGHDVNIGTGCIINPHAHLSGFVRLEDEILIGAHAVILESLNITSNTLIGAGAVLTKNIIKSGIYTGIPARQK